MKIVPAEASVLIDVPEADILLLDARREIEFENYVLKIQIAHKSTTQVSYNETNSIHPYNHI